MVTIDLLILILLDVRFCLAGGVGCSYVSLAPGWDDRWAFGRLFFAVPVTVQTHLPAPFSGTRAARATALRCVPALPAVVFYHAMLSR